MQTLVILLLVLLIVAALFGAALGFQTDGKGSNPINDAAHCAQRVKDAGGNIFDLVGQCNPVASQK